MDTILISGLQKEESRAQRKMRRLDTMWNNYWNFSSIEIKNAEKAFEKEIKNKVNAEEFTGVPQFLTKAPISRKLFMLGFILGMRSKNG